MTFVTKLKLIFSLANQEKNKLALKRKQKRVFGGFKKMISKIKKSNVHKIHLPHQKSIKGGQFPKI